MFIEDFELTKNTILVGVYTPENAIPNFIIKVKEFTQWLLDTGRLSLENNFLASLGDIDFSDYWDLVCQEEKEQDLLEFIKTQNVTL